MLITDGCSNHDWRLTTRCIRAILEPTGLFEVTVSTSPPTAASPGWDTWRPQFSDYDVVIQHYNDINGGAAWPAAVRTAFENYVHGGGGVYVWHAGNNAFPDWPGYNRNIGLGWRKKDRGAAEAAEVLAYANDEVRTKLNWPVEWTVSYGAGRVYVSSFGHVWKGDVQPVTVRDAGVQTILIRALQWLAKRPVTFPVPPDFPTETATSVRAELPLPPEQIMDH